MRPAADARVVRLAESEAVSFGPLARYQRLTGDDGHPVFTGVQTCEPGYATPLHWHPYVESLFVLEGEMEAWTEGREDAPLRLGPGDMVVLPACTPHVFRNAGPSVLRLLGIHASPTRIVNRIEASPSGTANPAEASSSGTANPAEASPSGTANPAEASPSGTANPAEASSSGTANPVGAAQ